MNPKAVIIGIKGPELTEDEKSLLEKERPLGVILFARNIITEDVIIDGVIQGKAQNKEKLRDLIIDIKEILGEKAVIAVDQEGGRVTRVLDSNFPEGKPPAAAYYGELVKEENLDYALNSCKENYKIDSQMLYDLGINWNFAPVADVHYHDAHSVIGDRSFSSDPDIVVELVYSALKGIEESGLNGIIKHAPGHGRSIVDSHNELPVVEAVIADLENTDFKVYSELSKLFDKDQKSIIPIMVAHIIYKNIDPDNPASTSKLLIEYIRDHILKCDENDFCKKMLVVSDAIEMKALHDGGDVTIDSLVNATEKCFDAGVDIVISGKCDVESNSAILGVAPELNIENFDSVI